MHGIVLWVTVLAADDAAAAESQACVVEDGRVEQWWDADSQVGEHFRPLFGLHGPAWDLYLLYRPSVRWESELPPAPSFWMHQISHEAGADKGLYLDPSRLNRELDILLSE